MRNLTEELTKIRGEVRTGVALTMQGFVQCSVVDAKTGQVVHEYPKQKNLILNNGMDQMGGTQAGNVPICDLFLYAVAGTGTTPTSDSGGVTTASQAGTTVTLVGGTFTFTNTGTDAGKMIKFLSGEEARVVTVTSGTVVVVDRSQTVVATTFTVYRTNQTGLAAETKRTNTYLTGSSNCGSTWASNVVTHKRTYDFTAEGGSITYNELGFSYISSSGNNLFSRILLGAGVALVATQQLRVVYSLVITWTPSTPSTIGSSPITGWSGATGKAQIQARVASEVLSSGATGLATANGSAALEPNNTVSGSSPQVVLSSTSTAHNTFLTAGPTRTACTGAPGSATLTLASYTSFNFYRDKSITFALNDYNVSNIRCVCLVESSLSGANEAFTYIIDADQSKDNLHTLTLTFRISWGRTLA